MRLAYALAMLMLWPASAFAQFDPNPLPPCDNPLNGCDDEGEVIPPDEDDDQLPPRDPDLPGDVGQPNTPVPNPVAGRLCLSDTLFLDVPLRAPGFDPAAIELARSVFEAKANEVREAWFCPDSELRAEGCGVVIPEIRVERIAVFDPRVSAARQDGHERFHRLRFRGVDNTARSLNSEAVCDAVLHLRDIAQKSLGFVEPTDLRVGRECEASAAQAEENTPPWQDDAASWHLERIGADAHGDVGKRVRGLPKVFVAMIDTAIEPLVARKLGVTVRDEDPLVPLDRDADGEVLTLFPHATAMALLVRQVAGAAKLFVYPSFTAKGTAALWAVARSVDNALHDPKIAANKPLVVNLSLGFRPELVEPSHLGGLINTDGAPGGLPPGNYFQGCGTWEDGAGEPLYYIMDVARQLDASRDATGRGPREVARGGSITVVSAAGNFYTPFGDEPESLIGARHPVGDVPEYYACGLPAEFDFRPLYPGAWGNDRPCPRLTLAVSSTGAADETSTTTRFDGEQPLVAPGDRITVWPGDAWAHRVPERPDTCPPATPSDWAFYLPFTLSGSSTSAALTSGAAARIESLRRSLNRDRKELEPRPRALPRLTAYGLSRLLYLTGERVLDDSGRACRLTRKAPENGPVRRLSVERAEAALTCPGAPDEAAAYAASRALIQCLLSSGDTLVSANDCAPLLYGPCLPQDADACPASAPVPVGPDPDRLDACTVADQTPAGTDCDDELSCYTSTLLAGSASLGSAGPTPGTGSCEDCWAFGSSSDRELDFYGRFWGGYYGSRFVNPRMIVRYYDTSFRKRTVTVSLDSTGIVPGGSVLLRNVYRFPSNALRYTITAELVVEHRWSIFSSTLKTPLGRPLGL